MHLNKKILYRPITNELLWFGIWNPKSQFGQKLQKTSFAKKTWFAVFQIQIA